MNLLVLGKGKTGSLVAEIAEQRGHQVTVAGSVENAGGAALSPEKLRGIDVVVDFTSPKAVIANIEACTRARKNMVVGTTGWYQDLAAVRQLVEQSAIGFLYGSNFSIGVNLFFDIARTAATALNRGYQGKIAETHHIHKKDAPSGTAVMLRNIMQQDSAQKLEIDSIREGDLVGTHTIVLESSEDSITLTHAARSRRGFAAGAIRAAEWIANKQGFYDFRDVFRELM
ncbi:MAG TPA: dihydrodipicolinate reductase C-terminal domain-containing protein [Terriglobales bacterium]|nr:dihydrodipicolinate reductase C-terminal domain-containing protein [Terriglobales bacterium]